MKNLDDVLNTIICGDCIKTLPDFPENSVDLIVTSPPYNINIQYDKYNDKIDWVEYYKWTEKWLRECYRVLKNDGRICINHYLSFGYSNYRTAPLMEINTIALNIGYKHHSVVVWFDRTLSKKTAWGSWKSASSPYINSPNEGILILYKNQWKKEKKGKSTINSLEFVDLCRGIWKIPTEPNQTTKANFPIALPYKCIRLLSYEGDIVLDPFSCGGTTCLSALKNNRQYIGIELSDNYCKKSIERLETEMEKNYIDFDISEQITEEKAKWKVELEERNFIFEDDFDDKNK